MEVPTEADPAEQVQECPVLRRLGAFQPGSLLSQGAEAVRPPRPMRLLSAHPARAARLPRLLPGAPGGG